MMPTRQQPNLADAKRWREMAYSACEDGVVCPADVGVFYRKELADQVREVRELRALYTSIEENINEKQAAWVKENEKLLRTGADHKARLSEAETSLRELTLAVYQKTGDKKPVRGVGIRMVKICEFEPVEAKKWAIEKGACLKLDEAAYKAALTKGIFDCMPGTVKEVPQATIGKDL